MLSNSRHNGTRMNPEPSAPFSLVAGVIADQLIHGSLAVLITRKIRLRNTMLVDQKQAAQ